MTNEPLNNATDKKNCMIIIALFNEMTSYFAAVSTEACCLVVKDATRFTSTVADLARCDELSMCVCVFVCIDACFHIE